MTDDALPAVTLPAVRQPTERMPTVHLYRHALDPGGGFRDEKVTGFTRLVPFAELQVIKSELEGRLDPAGDQEGLKMAKLLIGSYTGRKVLDPDTYVRAITSVFAGHPRDIGYRAIDELTLALRWLPERADVHMVLSRMFEQRKRMLRTAEAHLAEHERRRRAAEEPTPQRYSELPPEKRARFDAMMADYRRGLVSSGDLDGTEVREDRRDPENSAQA